MEDKTPQDMRLQEPLTCRNFEEHCQSLNCRAPGSHLMIPNYSYLASQDSGFIRFLRSPVKLWPPARHTITTHRNFRLHINRHLQQVLNTHNLSQAPNLILVVSASNFLIKLQCTLTILERTGRRQGHIRDFKSPQDRIRQFTIIPVVFHIWQGISHSRKQIRISWVGRRKFTVNTWLLARAQDLTHRKPIYDQEADQASRCIILATDVLLTFKFL